MKVNLKLNRDLFAPHHLPYLTDYSTRWETYMGSAGSGKSFFITQKLIYRAIREPIRILVCRRYQTTIRNTVFSLFKDIIVQWKLSEYVKINESDFRIRFPNGSEILFCGLDDETKLLSLNNIGTVWIEEAWETTQDIVEQLNLRMRGKNANQQIIMSFNPISTHHWLYDFCQNPPESYRFIHSTYRDNPFLSEDYIRALEELKVRNPQKARIFCDGEWGLDSEGLVFTNWETQDIDVLDLPLRAGSDFGYRDPTAVIVSYYDASSKTIYVVDEFYKAGIQLDEMASAINNLHLKRTKIFCDSAEPRTIDFLRKQNINAVPCLKGQHSVEARIAFLQNHKIVVSPRCTNIIRELENFSYIKDKKTGEWTSNTTHEFSHAIDALGYAYSDIYTKSNLKTFDKSVLGL